MEIKIGLQDETGVNVKFDFEDGKFVEKQFPKRKTIIHRNVEAARNRIRLSRDINFARAGVEGVAGAFSLAFGALALLGATSGRVTSEISKEGYILAGILLTVIIISGLGSIADAVERFENGQLARKRLGILNLTYPSESVKPK